MATRCIATITGVFLLHGVSACNLSQGNNPQGLSPGSDLSAAPGPDLSGAPMDQDLGGPLPDLYQIPPNSQPFKNAGTCPTPKLCWEMPLPSGAPLEAIAAAGPDDVWAVGRGTLLHFDGTAFTHAADHITEPLKAVHARTPTDVWAVGDAIYHYDGARIAKIPGPLVEGGFTGVFAAGPSDVFIVGPFLSVYRWDGAFWRVMPTAKTDLWRDVWGSGPNDVWIVGAEAEHYDGLAFRAMNIIPGNDFTSVWGRSSSEVYLAGNNSTLVRIQGGVPSAFFLPFPNLRSVSSVFGSGAKNLWVTGETSDPAYSAKPNLVMHHDGTSWTVMQVDIMDGMSLSPPKRGAATSRGDVFVAANKGILRNRGASMEQSFQDVFPYWQNSCYRADSAVTYVAGGTRGANSQGVMLVKRGGRWSQETLPVVPGLVSVAGTANFAVAVGEQGTVLQYDGTRWFKVAGIDPRLRLRKVVVESPTLAYAIGELPMGNIGPIILRYDGTGWTKIFEGQSLPIRDMWAGDGELYVLAATSGLLFKLTGNTLTTVLGPLAGEAMSGTGANDLWTVGVNGKVMHKDQNGWSQVAFPGTNPLHAVYAAAPNEVYFFDGKLFFRYDGVRFETTTLSTEVLPSFITLCQGRGPELLLNTGSGMLRWSK